MEQRYAVPGTSLSISRSSHPCGWDVHGPKGIRKLRKDLRDGGRYSVNHWFEGRTAQWQIGRLVLLVFVGPPPSDRHECCHRDDRPLNNDPANLYWGTRSENRADAVRNGRPGGARGERVNTAKLTAEQVMEIRRRYVRRGPSLATEFGVSSTAIRKIVRGQSWGHV